MIRKAEVHNPTMVAEKIIMACFKLYAKKWKCHMVQTKKS